MLFQFKIYLFYFLKHISNKNYEHILVALRSSLSNSKRVDLKQIYDRVNSLIFKTLNSGNLSVSLKSSVFFFFFFL
jgi:hypothetical protein